MRVLQYYQSKAWFFHRNLGGQVRSLYMRKRKVAPFLPNLELAVRISLLEVLVPEIEAILTLVNAFSRLLYLIISISTSYSNIICIRIVKIPILFECLLLMRRYSTPKTPWRICILFIIINEMLRETIRQHSVLNVFTIFLVFVPVI